MGMLLLFDHISNHIYDYYFFLALNCIDGLYTHNCPIRNIFNIYRKAQMYSVILAVNKNVQAAWHYKLMSGNT